MWKPCQLVNFCVEGELSEGPRVGRRGVSAAGGHLPPERNKKRTTRRFPVSCPPPHPHPTPTPVAWGAVVVSFFFYAVVVRAEDSTTTTSTTTTSTTTTATTTTAGGSVVALATGKTRSYWPMADRFRSFFFFCFHFGVGSGGKRKTR